MKLILASGSPRRKLLLSQFGIAFEIITADVDETRLTNECPADMTVRLAKLKALTVFKRCQNVESLRVLGGDTTVALNNRVFGKPADREEATEMLTFLSGKTHSVFSAVALVDERGSAHVLSETQVTFNTISKELIEFYCKSDDPYDKAGAYGIQGMAGQFVKTIHGSYSGVIGLPLWHTHQLLMGLVNPGNSTE